MSFITDALLEHLVSEKDKAEANIARYEKIAKEQGLDMKTLEAEWDELLKLYPLETAVIKSEFATTNRECMKLIERFGNLFGLLPASLGLHQVDRMIIQLAEWLEEFKEMRGQISERSDKVLEKKAEEKKTENT